MINKVDYSKISWTGMTWNPWYGCQKVGPECKYCYWYRDAKKYGRDARKVTKSKTKFNHPEKISDPQLIFTCSWSDWFIDEADQWRDEAWEVIKNTPQHTYQILTKRPERILANLPKDWGDGYDNVWIGVSVGHQETVDRIAELSKVPAKIRFVSFEPLISEIDLSDRQIFDAYNKIDWCILGGESGNDNGQYKYRPCELEWFEKLVDFSRDADVSVFIKQMGTYISKQIGCSDRHGTKIEDFPKHLQLQEFPIEVERMLVNKVA